VATSIVNQAVYSPVASAANLPRPRLSVYEIVTQRIIEQLEGGVAPWRKPRSSKTPANLSSTKEYRGLNVLMLGSQGFASRFWLTFNRANKLGGRIKRGAKGSLIVYWNIGEEREISRPDGTTKSQTPFLLRYSTVFNLSQTEGIDIPARLLSEQRENDPLADCEAIVSAMPNRPRLEQSDAAWYRPSVDAVGMPHRNAFHSSAECYSTLFHELAHSTGHSSRLGREGFDKPAQFGSESYSREELIAECTAAMLCGVTGIQNETLPNSSSYLQSWIARLKSDSKLIVQAASAAQKAADFIRGESANDSPVVEAN
jgi:antirestriction protein ArdC